MVDAIADFLNRTKPGSDKIRSEMNWLKRKGITEQKFSEFCQLFAKGVQYVKEKYGTVPDTIGFYDGLTPIVGVGDPFHAATYSREEKTIYINLKFVEEYCRSRIPNKKLKKLSASRAEEIPISYAQQAVLAGVEESYHHWQFHGSESSRFTTMSDEYYSSLPRGSVSDHEKNPIEIDANDAVVRAAKDMGFIQKSGLGI